uniref:Uncharacterized protein n=1 Tax=Anguilla anguilla TaxID=7936 RepID=A0A0E9R492_ANGAN
MRTGSSFDASARLPVRLTSCHSVGCLLRAFLKVLIKMFIYSETA